MKVILKRFLLNTAGFGCVLFASGLLHSSVAALGNVYVLSQMVDSSDTIVIARVILTTETTTTEIWHARLEILQTLKGTDVPAEVSFTFTRTELGPHMGPTRDCVRIVFLHHEGSTLRLTNLHYHTLPALDAPLQEVTDPLGAVILAEGNVLASPDHFWSDKTEAINALGECRDPRSRAALRIALNDTAINVRLEAVARLARQGDTSAVEEASKALLDPPLDVRHAAFLNLRVGIRDGARTEADVPSLTRLLTANEDATREVAAEALRHIASRSVIAPLSQALGDSDWEVRFFAVVGLATMTGEKEHLPSFPEFRSNEAAYTPYWTQWAAAQ